MFAISATFALALSSVFAPDGAWPAGGVTDGGDALYGMTTMGGKGCVDPQQRFGCGVVYRINYDGSGYTVLHAFSGPDGERPAYTLVAAPNGVLYGRTSEGGSHGRGVVFRVNHDGSAFRVLYDEESFLQGDDSPQTRIAALASGAVYAAVPRENGSWVLDRLTQTGAQTAVDLGQDVKIRDLESHGDTLYALASRIGSCGWQIYQIDAENHDRIIAQQEHPQRSTFCRNGPYIERIAVTSDGTLFGVDDTTVFRIGGGTIRKVFTVDRSWSPYAPPTWGTIGAVAAGAGGRLLLYLSALPGFNSGSVLSLGPHGDVRTEILLHDRYFAIGGRDYVALATTRKEIYATAFVSGDCDPGERQSAPTACGSIVAISRGQMRTLYAFQASQAPAPAPSATPLLFDDWFVATGDPGRFLLLRTTNVLQHLIAATPSPVPFALQSVDTKQRIALSPYKYVQTPKNFWTRPGIPAIEYSAPAIPAGMYAAPSADDPNAQHYYFPQPPRAVTTFATGQQYLAVAGPWSNAGGIVVDNTAMLDANNNFLGTSPIVLQWFDAHGLTFRVEQSGETLHVPGTYRAPADVPGVAPITTDAASDRVRDEFVGKTVYAFRFDGLCEQSGGGVQTMLTEGPQRVRAVYRLYHAAANLSIDGSGGPYSAFTAVDPMVILLDPPQRSQVMGGSGNGSMDPSDCDAFYVLAADPWHIDHIFSAHPLIDPAWSPAIRAAIAQRKILQGMTRAMVVAALGYPPAYGDAASFERLDEWDYDYPNSPSEDSGLIRVVFKDGRVISATQHGKPMAAGHPPT